MKFALSLAAYMIAGAALITGVVLAAHGNYWLLIAAFLTYLVALIKFGCHTH